MLSTQRAEYMTMGAGCPPHHWATDTETPNCIPVWPSKDAKNNWKEKKERPFLALGSNPRFGVERASNNARGGWRKTRESAGAERSLPGVAVFFSTWIRALSLYFLFLVLFAALNAAATSADSSSSKSVGEIFPFSRPLLGNGRWNPAIELSSGSSHSF